MSVRYVNNTTLPQRRPNSCSLISFNGNPLIWEVYNAPSRKIPATANFLRDVMCRLLMTGIGNVRIQASNAISMLFIANMAAERSSRYSVPSSGGGVFQKLVKPRAQSMKTCSVLSWAYWDAKLDQKCLPEMPISSTTTRPRGFHLPKS